MATSPTPSKTGEQPQGSSSPGFGVSGAAARLDPHARDQLLWKLLVAYRTRPNRAQIAPLILGMVRSQLEVRRLRLSPQEPYLDAEDIAQQLVLEILDLALRLPLQDGAFLERRLLLRAIERVTRRLKREARYRHLVGYFPPDSDEEQVS